FNEAALTECQDLGPYHASRVLPKQQCHHEHNIPNACAKKRDEDNNEGQEWDAEGNIRKPHQNSIDPSPIVAGYEADRGPDEHDEKGRGESNCERRSTP